MNKPTEFKIELLPQGVFVITLTNGQFVKGRFSMYALDRFSESKGLTDYMSAVVKITMGMKLHEYAELLVMAFQDYYRQDFAQCPWNVERVMDEIIDPMGGLGNAQSLRLFKHAVGRLTEIVEEPEEKKNLTAKKKK